MLLDLVYLCISETYCKYSNTHICVCVCVLYEFRTEHFRGHAQRT